MNNPKRRDFLKTAALAASASQAQAAQGAQTPALAAKQEASVAAPAARRGIQYPRTFSGRNLAMLAFPLGGVAAGCVSLGGRGQLRDWEIFNRPDKGRSLNYSFPGIWVQTGDSKPIARVLEARLMPPYHAASGLSPNNVSGLARLDGATFTGEYPLATVAFRDRKLPVRVTLEAFTPFVPLEADDSGLPVAVLRYRVRNPGKQPAKVSIAWSLDNPAGVDPRRRGDRSAAAERVNEYRTGAGVEGLFLSSPNTPKDDPSAGSLALCVLGAGDGRVSHLRGWPRAKWWASPLLFWDDFSEDGQLGPEPAERNNVGSLCLQREIAAGAEAEYTFLLAWHFPNRTAAWCGWSAPKGDENTIIGNHYSERFRDAWHAAEHTAASLPALEKRMRQFVALMRQSTLPAAVKEAAMANVSTLATPVCFRTADGRFRGFEGANDNSGCCFGNCSHVWNYESVSQHLFPSLARSQREAGFETAGKMDGVLPIRVQVPEGKQTSGTTAIDGTMGQLIRAYLDWRLSGDQAWLRSMWPNIRKTMEFAWIEGGWDGDRDGVPEGVQHNTFDVEFYGPNPMCGIYYLGGLRACEEMARAVGESAFADNCRALYARGSKWIDENLFNGEYYIQKVKGIPTERIAPALRSRGGAEDTENPDFQAGEGCLTDQLVGQYVATVAGLGSLVDPAKIRKTLASIYKYNYRHSLEEHSSVERIYALNDEAGLLLCDYGKAKRPRIPFPYFSEVWTGFEYEIAALMMYYGMEKEGIEIVTNARLRYDGERRNPWDELECGHHYVRAMASWSGVLALSGFRYHGGEQSVSAAPRVGAANFSSFWSTGTGWGAFSQTSQNGKTQFRLSVAHGKLPCRSVELARAVPAGSKTSAKLGGRAVAHEVRRAQGRTTFVFTQPIELAEGDRLELEA